MMATTMYQLLGSSILCGGNNSHNSPARIDPKERAKSRRQAREEAAKSKSGLWGPTHSIDTDDASVKNKNANQSTWFGGGGGGASPTPEGTGASPTSQSTNSTKSSTSSGGEKAKVSSPNNLVGCVWNNLQCQEDTTDNLQCQEETTDTHNQFLDYVEAVCAPCQPRNSGETLENDISDEPPALGICRLEPPVCHGVNDVSETSAIEDQHSTETPVDRRRQRHKQRQLRSSPPIPHEDYEVTTEKVLEQPKVPVESLTLVKEDAVELERSISELTMRSSYGQATAKLAENRRMAYYAVGRHHRQSGRGGNRRCYFTGKLILGGAPFYAGSVQQGLRTLVVFCLPSAIGLPKEQAAITRDSSVLQSLGDSQHHHNNRSRRNLHNHHDNVSVSQSIGVNAAPKSASLLSRKGSRISSFASVDDMDLSVEEELDPNWGLDREYLLSVLPEPLQNLLDEMAKRYPAQFETLPLQVRSPHCWRLYVKFCFFSGLPIAEGEMHYQVREEIADQYGEEIILSHEVMEAVNGESAEILRLPNLKTFRYLRKHYNQQSAKVPDPVFQRQAWEMVRPEI